MDLMSIGHVKDTTEVELRNPLTDEPLVNDDGSAMTITVHGPYSKTYKRVSHEQQNRRLNKAARGGRVNLNAAEFEAGTLELLLKCIEKWNITVDGQRPGYDESFARQLFEKLPWIREQIEVVFTDSKAFLE